MSCNQRNTFDRVLRKGHETQVNQIYKIQIQLFFTAGHKVLIIVNIILKIIFITNNTGVYRHFPIHSTDRVKRKVFGVIPGDAGQTAEIGFIWFGPILFAVKFLKLYYRYVWNVDSKAWEDKANIFTQNSRTYVRRVLSHSHTEQVKTDIAQQATHVTI